VRSPHQPTRIRGHTVRKNVTTPYCLAKPGEIYLVYLPQGGTNSLDLTGSKGKFSVQWFNPRSGGALTTGSVQTVTGGTSVTLGEPSSDAGKDWLAIIRKTR
ncbi:MAG: hypothetical protein O2945_17270, partial [Planctomycetota bacterium]|nr:hypothetical protein [Planctomycetota bacterium]